MKNVALFFFFLCVHLLGGYGYAHANDHNKKVSISRASGFEQSHEVESATANHDYVIASATSLSEENASLISMEDEDENDDLIKKHVSQARYFLAFCYSFILNSRVSLLAEPLPSCNQAYTSSCKYILQRALRI